MKYLTPVDRLNEDRCQNILETSEDISDVIELLSDLEYKSILKQAVGNLDETRALFAIETALNKMVYEQIQKAINKLKGRDKKIAQTVLGMEIDSINIKIILRCKSIGINNDQIMKYLLTSKTFNKNELDTALEATDIKSFIGFLLSVLRNRFSIDYTPLLKELLREYEASKSLSQLEIILDRNLLETNLRMVKKYTPYFNISLILAFLNAKWFEIRNLRAIIIGAKNNRPREMIMKLLIFSN